MLANQTFAVAGSQKSCFKYSKDLNHRWARHDVGEGSQVFHGKLEGCLPQRFQPPSSPSSLSQLAATLVGLGGLSMATVRSRRARGLRVPPPCDSGPAGSLVPRPRASRRRQELTHGPQNIIMAETTSALKTEAVITGEQTHNKF